MAHLVSYIVLAANGFCRCVDRSSRRPAHGDPAALALAAAKSVLK
jgi:hypothetical protein